MDVVSTERVQQTVPVKTDTKWRLTEHVSIARYKTWRRGTITRFVLSTGLMRVAVSAAGQIGTSTKTAAVIVPYVNRLKCLTDTMIVCARTETIAVQRVAVKRKRVLTARLVVQQLKSVRTRCSPFAAPTAKPASTEVVVRRQMRMRQNVVPTVSGRTVRVAPSTRLHVPTARLLTTMDVLSVKLLPPALIRKQHVQMGQIHGVAQRVILAEQPTVSVAWAENVARMEERDIVIFMF